LRLQAADRSLTQLTVKASAYRLPGHGKHVAKASGTQFLPRGGKLAGLALRTQNLTKCAPNFDCKSLSREVRWQKLHRRAARRVLSKAIGTYAFAILEQIMFIVIVQMRLRAAPFLQAMVLLQAAFLNHGESKHVRW
jgi:hypothetical protein